MCMERLKCWVELAGALCCDGNKEIDCEIDWTVQVIVKKIPKE